MFDSGTYEGGLIDYSNFKTNNPDKLPMVVVFEGDDEGIEYYIGYNGGGVTVTKVESGQYSLAGYLRAGDSLTVPIRGDSGADLIVEVKEIDGATAQVGMQVEVSTTKGCICIETCVDTFEPSSQILDVCTYVRIAADLPPYEAAH